MTKYTGRFHCKDGLSPCSTNANLGGSTLCVADVTTDCPVVDIAIYDGSETCETKPKLCSDSGYVVSTMGGMQLVYTTGYNGLQYPATANDLSNAPLLNLLWQYGQPCAYLLQAPVWTLVNKPIFYPLERADSITACQNWPADSDSANLGVAKDTRYNNLAQFTPLPNEY